MPLEMLIMLLGGILLMLWFALRWSSRSARMNARLGMASVEAAETPVTLPLAEPPSGRYAFLRRKLRQAGLPMGPADVLLICGLMGVGVYWLLYDFGVPTLLAVSVGCLTAYLPFMGLNTYAERRVRKLEIQLSEALDLMVSALRAGVPVRQTMELVRAEKKPPIRNEFHELISLIQLGVPPSQAFKQWAQPLGSKTLDSFAIAMATKWDVGGNYADMLLSMAERIRESIRLRRRVETLTAEAKLTTFLAILLPYGIAYIMSRMNPGHFSVLWDDPGARSILFLALLIQVGAIFWIRRMIRSVS